MGPWPFARQIQQSIHKLIGSEQPRGWQNQLPNDILININVAFEKQILAPNKWSEIVAGGQLCLGSMKDAAGVYSIVRAGKISSYFNGTIDQSSASAPRAKMAVVCYGKTAITYMAYNAILQGGFILKRNPVISADINRINLAFDYGLSFANRNFSLSLIQKAASSPIDDRKPHETGNITLNFSW